MFGIGIFEMLIVGGGLIVIVVVIVVLFSGSGPRNEA